MKINCSEDCDRSYYFKGCRIGRDPGMPESSWGSYLPGDEPGLRCRLTDELCGEIDHIECPLYEEVDNFICTIFGVDGYCDEKCEKIIVNDNDQIVICPESDEELECQIINDKYIVGVVKIEELDKFDKDPKTQQQIKSNYEKALLLAV